MVLSLGRQALFLLRLYRTFGKAQNETLVKQRTQKLRAPSGVALTEQVLALRCDCAAPLGLNKYAITNNPGLAPWAMQECRPCRAHLYFHHQSIYFIILMQLPLYSRLSPLSRHACSQYASRLEISAQYP